MKEFLDVLDDNGKKVGNKKNRKEIHKDGDWHASVHVWLFYSGLFVVQKRVASKESFPGCYDCSSAGHVDAGEELFQAALRETNEELGISISIKDLKLLGVQKLYYIAEEGNFVSNEHNYIFMGQISVEQADNILIDRSEVEEVYYLTIDELIEKRSNNTNECCFSDDELVLLQLALRKDNLI